MWSILNYLIYIINCHFLLSNSKAMKPFCAAFTTLWRWVMDVKWGWTDSWGDEYIFRPEILQQYYIHCRGEFGNIGSTFVPFLWEPGCYNPSQRGSMADRKYALSHRKCQLNSAYVSKDLLILHFVYLYAGYFFLLCFDYFGFICN